MYSDAFLAFAVVYPWRENGCCCVHTLCRCVFPFCVRCAFSLRARPRSIFIMRSLRVQPAAIIPFLKTDFAIRIITVRLVSFERVVCPYVYMYMRPKKSSSAPENSLFAAPCAQHNFVLCSRARDAGCERCTDRFERDASSRTHILYCVYIK